MNDAILFAFIWVLVSLVVFLIIRELVCWYWKINRIVELLEEIRGHLSALSGTVPTGSAREPTSAARSTEPVTPSPAVAAVVSGGGTATTQSQGFDNWVLSETDESLLAVLRKPNEYSEDTVKLARSEAKRRGIA